MNEEQTVILTLPLNEFLQLHALIGRIQGTSLYLSTGAEGEHCKEIGKAIKGFGDKLEELLQERRTIN